MHETERISLHNGSPIQTIEWNMMNKSKFYPLSMMSSFTIRCFLYPFTVIKTRIQIQHHSELYSGTFDAFRKIIKHEGSGTLYRGFWISAFQLVSGVAYITTYETVRQFLHNNKIRDTQIKALIGGGCASLVGQTIIVPFDIISQHMMVIGMYQGSKGGVLNPLNVEYKDKTKLRIASSIINCIYQKDGLRGFYKGYCASICAYVPNSALWWTFYHIYQGQLALLLPPGTSSLLLQCISAPLGGFTTTLLTNPLDTIRTRLQVQRLGGFFATGVILWREEGLNIFFKGLSPRLIQSVIFSTMIVFGYESVKRLSVSEEFEHQITW